MHLGKQITIALVALPLAELVVFLTVAMVIGVTAALALMVLTTLAGVLVLRHVGRTGIAQVRLAVADPAIADKRGGGSRLFLAVGGILLILPGFITDFVGALLLVAPVRQWLGATIRRWSFAPRDPPGRDAVVDLAPGEWRQVGDTPLPRPRESGDEH